MIGRRTAGGEDARVGKPSAEKAGESRQDEPSLEA